MCARLYSDLLSIREIVLASFFSLAYYQEDILSQYIPEQYILSYSETFILKTYSYVNGSDYCRMCYANDSLCNLIVFIFIGTRSRLQIFSYSRHIL